jgi:hypothetical protein
MGVRAHTMFALADAATLSDVVRSSNPGDRGTPPGQALESVTFASRGRAQGSPRHRQSAGTSAETTLPAPTTDPRPMWTPGAIVAPCAIQTSSPIRIERRPASSVSEIRTRDPIKQRAPIRTSTAASMWEPYAMHVRSPMCSSARSWQMILLGMIPPITRARSPSESVPRRTTRIGHPANTTLPAAAVPNTSQACTTSGVLRRRRSAVSIMLGAGSGAGATDGMLGPPRLETTAPAAIRTPGASRVPGSKIARAPILQSEPTTTVTEGGRARRCPTTW